MAKDKKAEKMEKHLLKTQFPKECEELPFDKLDEDEQAVVTKCINHEELSDDEFSLLKMTLQKYREYIRKHKPSETVEAMKQTVQIIKTEKEFLDILDDETNKILRVHLPYQGNVYEFDFEILPIDNSRIVEYMDMNIDLFKDYGPEERELFTRSQEGGDLTPEELAIVEKMTKDLNAIASEEKAKITDRFLASQLRLPESTQDYNARVKFWQRFPFLEKWAIVTKVEDRLGLTEKHNEKLFPDG